jgi:hypothetical protein
MWMTGWNWKWFVVIALVLGAMGLLDGALFWAWQQSR